MENLAVGKLAQWAWLSAACREFIAPSIVTHDGLITPISP
jgi:hypothetical protein